MCFLNSHSGAGKETKVLWGYFPASPGAFVGLMGRSGFYKAGRGNNFQDKELHPDPGILEGKALHPHQF